MAKKDRTITLEEVLAGKVSQEYIDKKERKAILERRIRRVVEQIFDIDDKLAYFPENNDFIHQRNKLIEKRDLLIEQSNSIVL